MGNQLEKKLQSGLTKMCEYVGVYPYFTTKEDMGYEAVIEAYGNNEPMPIWEGASENTIWGRPDYNIMFRALHDTIHMRYECDFSLEGELKASRIQGEICDILNLPVLKIIMHIETAGQALYYDEHGKFPPQSFTLDTYTKSK